MICWRSLATLWTGWANRATSRQAQPWTRPAPTRPTAIIMPSSIHGPEAAIRRQGPTEFITANGRRSSRLNNGAIRETAKSITAVRDPSLDHIIRPSNPSFWLFFVYTSVQNKSHHLWQFLLWLLSTILFLFLSFCLSPPLYFFLKRDSSALMMMMMAGDKELLERRNNCTYFFHLCCGTCVTCVTRGLKVGSYEREETADMERKRAETEK